MYTNPILIRQSLLFNNRELFSLSSSFLFNVSAAKFGTYWRVPGL